MRRFLLLMAAGACLCSMSIAQSPQPAAQDQPATEEQKPTPAPSLAEVARQLKLKRQQKEAQPKAKQAAQDGKTSEPTPAPKTAHLVTNDDAPEHATVTPASDRTASPAGAVSDADAHNAKAETWKSQIIAQRSAIAALEQDIKTIGDSIHYAGANCVANCAQWNEHQQQKQQEVEGMKSQLEQAQKQLEQMQESARREGFGSSVYDP